MKKMILTFTILFLFLTVIVLVLKNPLFGAVKYDPTIDIKVDQEELKETVKNLTTTHGPRNYFNPEGLNEAAKFISDEFMRSGFQPEEQKYMADGVEVKNIICSYGPAEAERIIIGAHYDVCEEQSGADDNASGIAGLLEIARLLNTLKPDLKYRIDLVAYTLEEPPYFRTDKMGSAIHAKYLYDNKIKIKAMVCLEMIGFYTDKPKSQEYPMAALKTIYPTTGNFIAVVGRIGDDGLTKSMKRRMTEASQLGVESINAPASLPGIDFSDHLNYWKYRFPAIMITDTSFYRNKNYHRKSDKMDTLNFEKMAEVVKGVYWGIVNI